MTTLSFTCPACGKHIAAVTYAEVWYAGGKAHCSRECGRVTIAKINRAANDMQQVAAKSVPHDKDEDNKEQTN